MRTKLSGGLKSCLNDGIPIAQIGFEYRQKDKCRDGNQELTSGRRDTESICLNPVNCRNKLIKTMS